MKISGKKTAFALIVLALAATTSISASARELGAALTAQSQGELTSDQSIALLKAGNERFLNGTMISRNLREQVTATAAGQFPHAVILGCVDSRVPPEMVFDQGIGDIFTARVAGNFVDAELLGSMEFAVAVAGARSIVVLGHTECGAVKGACDNVQLGNLTSTLANLAPAVYSVTNIEGERSSKNAAFVNAVAHKNVHLTVSNIVERSPVLSELVAAGKLKVVGAMYDVSTGKVNFL